MRLPATRRPLLVTLLSGLLAIAAAVAAPTASAKVPAPVVTGLSVHSGPSLGGQLVTIHGRHLDDSRAISFGSRAIASPGSLASTSLTVQTPRIGRDTSVIVRVATWKGGASARTPAAAYSFVNAPVVSRLTPLGSLPAGRRVAIYGRDFRAVRSVTFGGAAGSSIHMHGAGLFTVIAPAHKPGVVDVVVHTAYGRSYPSLSPPSVPGDHSAFRYAAAPAITSVTRELPVTGGSLLVSGTALAGVDAVTVGGVAARVGQVSDTDVYVTAPAHVSGLADVRLRTPSGTSAVSSADRVLYSPAPTVGWQSSAPFNTSNDAKYEISCSTPTSCSAFDGNGIATMTDGAWTTSWPGVVRHLSCASDGFCAVLGNHTILTRVPGGDWTVYPSGVDWWGGAVSCASRDFCLAANGADLWRIGADGAPVRMGTTLDGKQVTSLSCVSSSFCLAGVAPGYGYGQLWDGTSWRDTDGAIGPGDMRFTACASAARCIGVSTDDGVVIWNGSGWGRPQWALPNDKDDVLAGASCAPDGTCFVIATNGDVGRFDPGQTTAQVAHGVTGGRGLITGLSCTTGTDCIVTDDNGDSVTLTAAGWGAPRAQFEQSDAVTGLSCPTVDFCAASDARGNVYVRQGGAWSAPFRVSTQEHVYTDVSCSSPSRCVVVTGDGPAELWDGTSWSAIAAPPTHSDVISCVASGQCLTPDATFDGTTWVAHAAPDLVGVSALSCAATTFCAAYGSGRLETFDGTAWSAPSGTTGPNDQGRRDVVSCPTVGFCTAEDGSDSLLAYGGQSWTAAPVPVGGAGSVACATRTFCQFFRLDGIGRTWNGSTWSYGSVPSGAADGASRAPVACPAPGSCTAATSNGASVGQVWTTVPR